MRRDVRRRALMVSVAAAAGGTVAVAWQRGKRQQVYQPVKAPGAPEVHLVGIDALRRTEPPAALPPVELVDASGGVHGLDEFRGKGLVINLWATWCVPCVAELPGLADLAGMLAGSGILVLPLSSDRGGAPVVEAFYRRHGIAGLPVWLDPGGAAQQAWGVRGIPTTLIVDRAGLERGRLEGGAEWASEAAVAGVRGLVG